MNELKQSLDNTGINKHLLRSLKETYIIKKKWRKIAGDVLYKELIFLYVKGDQCVVQARNTCWLTEIHMYKKTLLDNINTYITRKIKVSDIKIRVTENVSRNKNREFANKKNYDNMIGL